MQIGASTSRCSRFNLQRSIAYERFLDLLKAIHSRISKRDAIADVRAGRTVDAGILLELQNGLACSHFVCRECRKVYLVAKNSKKDFEEIFCSMMFIQSLDSKLLIPKKAGGYWKHSFSFLIFRNPNFDACGSFCETVAPLRPLSSIIGYFDFALLTISRTGDNLSASRISFVDGPGRRV